MTTRIFACALAALLSPAVATQTTATISGDPFPTTEIILVAVITLVVTLVIGALAGWKSKVIESSMEGSFERTGSCIGTHPCKTCVAAIFLTVAFGGGYPMKKQETDPAVLWVPSGSIVLDHKDYVDSTWSSEVFPVFVMGHDDSANVVTPEKIKALSRDHRNLMNITVDGDALVAMNKDVADYTKELGGQWSFLGTDNTRKMCYEFMPGSGVCQTNILRVFDYDQHVIDSLDMASLQNHLSEWKNAPMYTPVANGVQKTFELPSVLGGMKDDGSTISAEVIRTTYFMSFQDIKSRNEEGGDVNVQAPVISNWEADAVCHLGVEEKNPVSEEECNKPEGLTYTGFFMRSFADEFGEAILGDISNVALSYVLIFFYLLLMLGKWDWVWSKFSLSVVVLFVVGMAFGAANGLAGYLGVKENPLNNNIPFLILGLGVDDAFVLSSEFARHTLNNPEADVAQRIAMTAKTGGVSVLVTSVTDALAFLIGASTRLPALSAFCIYAGFAVAFCFVYMMIFFLPWLAIDAWRAEGGRFDCLCCVRAKAKHELGTPMGLCPCIPGCNRVQPDEFLSKALKGLGIFTVKNIIGKTLTLLAFFVIFVVGVSGVGQLKKEFKVEWFFPEGSYFEDFTNFNREFFSTGESFDVFLNDVDLYADMSKMNDLSGYIHAQEFILDNSIDDFWSEFTGRNTGYASLTREEFFQTLHNWCNGEGSRFSGNIKWASAACNDDSSSCTDAQKAEGISHAKIGATLVEFDSGKERYEVYRTYREDMKGLFGDESGKKVFPYTQAFLYWEENGIIDVELIRNLIIACGVIFTIVAALIPYPRVAILVSVNICAAILEIIGFAHYWDVTMNGVSTIYFLVCVGLSVDYSVHIAHTFADSTGESADRAVDALARIGPSVFNAVLSTIFAVIVLASSKSFVFEVFFKILCLVSLIAGSHGLVLLPTLLGMMGGSKEQVDPVKSATPMVVGKSAETDANVAGEAVGA